MFFLSVLLLKNKREDESIQKLRYESAFIVFVVSILIILVLYIVNPAINIDASFLLSVQMIFYLILRLIKRRLILEDWIIMKNKVKFHRVMLDKTQEELANAIGVSRQTIHAIEKNKFVPSVQTAMLLAKYFELSVERLFELEQ